MDVCTHINGGFSGGSDGKESACNAGDLGLIPGSGRSPGEGNSNPLQYSYLENSIDRGAWQLQSMRLRRVRHSPGRVLIRQPESTCQSCEGPILNMDPLSPNEPTQLILSGEGLTHAPFMPSLPLPLDICEKNIFNPLNFRWFIIQRNN